MTADLYLYQEPTALTLAVDDLAAWIWSWIPRFQIEVRAPVSWRYLESLPPSEREAALDALATTWAESRVRNPNQSFVSFDPLYGEVSYERRRLSNPESRAFGVLYDGERVQALCRSLIPREEAGLSHLHVIFTNQLVGTFDDGDRRYHLRTSLYGIPNIISTNGLMEAPAKPREYYLLKQQYAALGMSDATAILEPQFEERIVVLNDPRLTEIIKGYLMQAVFYHLTSDPFCLDPGCRLFNAHWQEEVIRAQLGGDYEFCPRHQEMLEQWR
ncbi:MAG: hypothetical protein M1380_00150 [Chloroflexi bacterium]|nr:hypothetical protein [Chloroflexota bacterium]